MNIHCTYILPPLLDVKDDDVVKFDYLLVIYVLCEGDHVYNVKLNFEHGIYTKTKGLQNYTLSEWVGYDLLHEYNLNMHEIWLKIKRYLLTNVAPQHFIDPILEPLELYFLHR